MFVNLLKNVKIPFNTNIDVSNINPNMNIDTEIEVLNQDFIVGTDSNIEDVN